MPRPLRSRMICLGIETSCDETSVGVWRPGHGPRDVVHSQVPMHAVFGGVVPELASREHLRQLDALVQTVVRDENLGLHEVDMIAVTRGPGLLGALLVGIAYAKSLALALEIPIVGVNHLHAHLLACEFVEPIEYPALGLLVSGGHTHLYWMQSSLDFELVGRTLDDAAGEAFDKIAKILNLPYPGGKYIDVLAEEGRADPRLFTRPYLNNSNCDFSFSGLKTAVAQYVASHDLLRIDYADFRVDAVPAPIKDLCASVNLTIVQTLLEKSRRALVAHPQARTLCVAGGVAANSMVRREFSRFATLHGLKFLVPDQNYCGDNGAMIAYTGQRIAARGLASALDFEAIPRGKHVPNDYIVNPFFKE